MDKKLKRISIMVREDQQEKLHNSGLNLSGLIRDLIDDYLGDHKVTIAVSEETMIVYNKIISNTGSTDEDLEIYFKDAMKKMLGDRIKLMQELERSLK